MLHLGLKNPTSKEEKSVQTEPGRSNQEMSSNATKIIGLMKRIMKDYDDDDVLCRVQTMYQELKKNGWRSD